MSQECQGCRLPKAKYTCSLCECALCKSCAMEVSADSFPFWLPLPSALQGPYVCGPCFDETVAPLQTRYEELLSQARGMDFVPKAYRGPVALIKKAKNKIQVKDQDDRSNVLMRLAFQAAEMGFNGLVDGEIKSEKFRNESGYQKMRWSGEAWPAQLDLTRMKRFEETEY